jgi:hypothetical protein
LAVSVTPTKTPTFLLTAYALVTAPTSNNGWAESLWGVEDAAADKC